MNSPPTTLPRPADRLRDLRAYGAGGECSLDDLRLDRNEGAKLDSDIASVLLAQASTWNRYPDAAELEARLASRHRVDPEQVLVTAGADGALDRICRSYLQPGRNAVCHQPSFEMLPRYVALAGGELRAIPWLEGRCPIDELARAPDPDTSLLFLVSPNNPTGLGVDADELRALAAACRGSLLVVDQAYAEFDATDIRATILKEQNAVLLGSFSKAYCLAGLRVGYAIGPANVISNLRNAGSPYPVSAPSLAIAIACLDRGEDWLDRSVPRVRRERRELSWNLRKHGFRVPESRANFALARGPAAGWLGDGLASLGIATRSFCEEDSLRDCLRITCPASEPEFARLISTIDTCLAPQAILFDLDGVIADVSRSYRLAIQRTARSWGLNLSADQIGAAKLKPDTNNDWLLTHRLLCGAGKSVSLSEVTRRFEEFYQGSGGCQGLYDRERLMISPKLLSALAARFPLAILTGRPRRDAERFLERHGIDAVFAAILCMEDGPQKPDPTIIKLALTHLGVTRAWLLGDAPDDLHAARAAGVLPIGVIAPGADPGASHDALAKARAATILRKTIDISEILR